MSFSYRLLDFGFGRKLEEFGGLLLDRPSPPAERVWTRELGSLWNQAAGRFRRSEGLKGTWQWETSPAPQSWTLETNHFSLILKPTEVGHLGVFAEQEPNWEWIYERTKFFLTQRPTFRVLNLFAYTGGSTLAAAAAMREAGKTSADVENFSISHVDSAKNIVQWARENAETSGLADAPVRWIGEDALKFTRRELKRGRKYDAVILDPPSYGHGTKGEVWKLERDLPELLKLCSKLISDSPAFVLLTAHSPGMNGQGIARLLQVVFPQPGRCDFYPMELKTASGRVLPSGEAARIDFS